MIALDRVTCVRGNRLLFEAMSLAVASGGAAIVTGPNGAGKSSLLRMAAGLLTPTLGAVRRDKPIAFLGDGHALDRDRRLGDALAFWAAIDRGQEALAALGLESLADLPVRLLSTGQRRRAGLARIVASGAPLWLLDEPANGLDAAGVVVLETLIAAHRGEGGAVIVATHQPITLPDAIPVRLG